ncbi:MAG: hypothetical protein V5A51_11260 [Bacteroidales bacterium]|nr:hypothetical protein [Bacteroidales bacterium]MBS3775768.1 hypothetical protein [Bacteroidales bacterium]
MKQIILRVPDNKYSFFIELLNNFDFVTIEEEGIEIPEEQKNKVRERMKKSQSNPSRLLKWNEVKKKIQF